MSSTRGAVGVASQPSVGNQAWQRLGDYLVLGKVRLSLMVLMAGLVGFWVASSSPPSLGEITWFALGSFLVVAGANAFNQVAECSQDKLMQRTAERPLPAGRMGSREAMAVAGGMSSAGLAILLLASNLLTVGLALTALLLYVFVYTPLKQVTSWSTLAGAVSGAIPPLMGWCAVRGQLEPAAWSLFGILFLWQFPHTWAIAATYREDYRRAGYHVLPLLDPKGQRTRRRVVGFSLALLAVSLSPAFIGLAGPWYFWGASVLGLGFVAFAFRAGHLRSRRRAIQLLGASLVYLPLILALLAFGRRSF